MSSARLPSNGSRSSSGSERAGRREREDSPALLFRASRADSGLRRAKATTVTTMLTKTRLRGAFGSIFSIVHEIRREEVQE
jgi:hypothetical protein